MAPALDPTNNRNKLSTQTMSPQLVTEIVTALKLVRNYGSIEIYVQNSVITQITVRNIKKTQVGIPRE